LVFISFNDWQHITVISSLLLERRLELKTDKSDGFTGYCCRKS
jgi:ABC-type histidine transport system ATPase subunit